jgi:hypothetical protein
VTRFAILVAAAVLTGACGSSPSSSDSTRLRIAVYPHGIGGVVRRYRLSCGHRPAGTVPQPARACRVLASSSHPFAPTPPGTTCSGISLGPQRAVVTGVVRGKRIHARLRVQGSCEIERWRRIEAVVPGFPRTS